MVRAEATAGLQIDTAGAADTSIRTFLGGLGLDTSELRRLQVGHLVDVLEPRAQQADQVAVPLRESLLMN